MSEEALSARIAMPQDVKELQRSRNSGAKLVQADCLHPILRLGLAFVWRLGLPTTRLICLKKRNARLAHAGCQEHVGKRAMENEGPLEEPGVGETSDCTTAVAEAEPASSKNPVLKALLHVKWANWLQKAGQHERAAEHFAASLAIVPSGQAFFGQGVALAKLRRRQEAAEAFQSALSRCPRMAGAWINLAGVELALGRCESAESHCRQALELEPGSREAVMNLANALRNLGRRQEAIEVVWEHILQHEKKERPSALRLADAKMAEPHQDPSLVVTCLKWGKRYSAAYVNRLYTASRRQLRRPARFVCFTEDRAGLDDGIEARPLPDNLPLWWGKAYLFSEEAGLDGHRVLFLDLDQVIVGDLDPFADYTGAFAVLGTEDVACELAVGGYNSSVICWKASPFFRQLYQCLTPSVLRFVHRFDHWLEMMVEDADRWQQLLPGKVLDYTAFFRNGVCLGCEADDGSFAAGGSGGPAEGQEAVEAVEVHQVVDPVDPPETCAIVTFPRSPKPHEVVDLHSWVRTHWLQPRLDTQGYVA